MSDLAIEDMPAGVGDFEPAKILDRLRGPGDRFFNGVLNAL